MKHMLIITSANKNGILDISVSTYVVNPLCYASARVPLSACAVERDD